ncbi:hypothetical protein TWF696_001963 [Orbilia brochopaga]|uniref:GRF-type domain-containing protein n=1 Tax=Orbilia brochopaga TaxID=3140254 RepID=A0AAV9U9D1_9PEZI
MTTVSPNRPSAISPSGHKNGIFVKNRWMCNCSPRLPAVNNKVRKQGNNSGRQFWACSKGSAGDQKSGCGFFLWREEAKIREQKALSSAGQPSNTATPSRKLHQKKISEFAGLHKPGKVANVKHNGDNADISKESKVVICLSDSTDTDDDPQPEPRNRKNKHSDEEKEKAEADAPRKAARTPKNTSPSKLKLLEESMASTTSFTSTSTIPDETPSSRLRKLDLSTPSSKARLQAEQQFDNITPVRRPVFGSYAKTPAPTALTDISGPCWSNIPPPSTAATTPEKPLSCADEIVDVRDAVFNVLKTAGVELGENERVTLDAILQRPMRKQKNYLKARDLIRSSLKKVKDQNDNLQSEIALLREKNAELAKDNDYLKHVQKTDKANLKSQRAEIEKIQKDKEELEVEFGERIEELEEENESLEERLGKLQKELDELN